MTQFQKAVLLAIVQSPRGGRHDAEEAIQQWLDRITLEATRIVDSACARFGHNWSPWWTTSRDAPEFESRWCENCHRLEQQRKVMP